MVAERGTRRNQEERPDRRRRGLRDIEHDDWREISRDLDIDFEDDLLENDLSDVDFEDESIN